MICSICIHFSICLRHTWTYTLSCSLPFWGMCVCHWTQETPSRDRLLWETQKQSLLDCFKAGFFSFSHSFILIPSPSHSLPLFLVSASTEQLQDTKYKKSDSHLFSYLAKHFQASREECLLQQTLAQHVFTCLVRSYFTHFVKIWRLGLGKAVI